MTGPRVPSRSQVSLQSHELVLARTRSLSRGVLAGIREAETAATVGAARRKAESSGVVEQLASRLRVKAQESSDAAKMAELQVRQVDEAIRQAGQSLSKLQHSRYAQHGSLKVCERRLELRQNCPGIDPAADATHQALHFEWQALSFARHDLLALEWEVKLALESLQAMRACLSQDAAVRRHAAEHCRAKIVSVQQAVLQGSAPNLVDLDDRIEATDDKLVLHRAFTMLSAAESLGRRVTEVVLRTGKEVRTAQQRTEQVLSNRVAEVEEAGKNLRKQALEVDYTIGQAERSLASTSKKLDASSRSSPYETTMAMLEELRKARQHLQVEIQLKVTQLSVDEACRKVTPQSASAMDANTSTMDRRRPGTAGKMRRPVSAMSSPALDAKGFGTSSNASLPRLGEPVTNEAQEPKRPFSANGSARSPLQ